MGKRKFSILVVGDGSQELHYKNMYSDLPITFIGNTQNPIKYLNLADIFFFPSRREGLGNSLIEAQILGINIISYDCPSGPKEIVDVFNNGMLFESENMAIKFVKEIPWVFSSNSFTFIFLECHSPLLSFEIT